MVRICPRAPGRTTIELLFRCPCSSDVGLVHARAPATLRPTFAVKDDRLFRLRSGVRLHAANSSLLEVDAYWFVYAQEHRVERLSSCCFDVHAVLMSGWCMQERLPPSDRPLR